MGELGDRAREMARIADWLARDEDDGAINADADGLKALGRRGWELKSGTLLAPAFDGTLVPMWPVASVFGGRDRQFAQRVLRTLQPGYKSLFVKFIGDVARHRSVSTAFQMLEGWEQKALSEGIDTSGGYAVPADEAAQILARMAAVAVVRPHATVVPCSSDYLRIPLAQAAASSAGPLSSGADSVFASGFIGTWAAESPAFTDVDPVTGYFAVPVKKTRTTTRLSNDLVADSGIDVLAFLARNGGANLALVEDQGFINGDASALKPRGILASSASTTNVSGTTANVISNTTANTGSAPKLKTLAYSLPSQYAANARWLALRATEGNIRGLVDAQGHFMFDEEEDASLLAKPLNDTPMMPADGTAGNKCLVFGDLSGYLIAQRTEISVTPLTERFADVGQTGFILRERVGGDMWDVDSVRIGVV